MCLKPNIIINRHYLKICNDDKSKALSHFGNALDFYVKVDCGLCIECIQKRGKLWRTRLLDEYHYYTDNFPDKKIQFCTLTIAPEYMHLFNTRASAQKCIRLFLERYRKRYGCSFRHFICSEYGEKRGRLHYHMIGFGMLCNFKELASLWKYGRVDMQTLKGPQGLTYVSGYITKVVKADKLTHLQPFFIERDKKTYVFVSPGLGLNYCLDQFNRDWHFSGKYPRYVRVRDNGTPFALPRYYLDKIFSPIDLCRRKNDYNTQLTELPKPPFIAHKRYFDDLASFADYVRSIGGDPTLHPLQFNLLPNNIKPLFNQINYGK